VTTFNYCAAHDPIRDDLAAAYRTTWAHIANPGTWLTGEQRIAVSG
jgi:hypothetical protein